MTAWVCLVGVRPFRLLANKILVVGAQPSLELILNVLHAVAQGMDCNAPPRNAAGLVYTSPVLQDITSPLTANFLPVDPNCIARNSP